MFDDPPQPASSNMLRTTTSPNADASPCSYPLHHQCKTLSKTKNADEIHTYHVTIATSQLHSRFQVK